MELKLMLDFDSVEEMQEVLAKLGSKAVPAAAEKAAPSIAAASTTAKVEEKKPVVAEKPAPVQQAVAQEEDLLGGEKQIDYETLWANVSAKIQAGHREPIKAELARLGAAKVSELKPDQFNAFNKFVLALA